MTQLNRAIAVSYRSGPEAAIPLVEDLRARDVLPHSYVVAAALANLYGRAGEEARALHFLDAALAQAKTPHERRLIELQVARASGWG